MPHVIFLNGPPRSGKDTAGRIIEDMHPNAYVVKFAHALKVGTHALFRALNLNLEPRHLESVMRDDTYEDAKEVPIPLFFGLTPRRAYIAVSEQLCKPIFGEQFFGKIIADHIKRTPSVDLWVITDSGFEAEALPVIKQVGPENCTLVRLFRDGCTFAGDSRRHIDLDVRSKFDLTNNGSPAELAYTLRGLLP